MLADVPAFAAHSSLIYQQLGEGAEVSFARDWGIGLAIEVRSRDVPSLQRARCESSAMTTGH